MSLWKTFCKNLKYYRIKKLYSQEKLGELTDLSPRYISAIECGRYSPTIITIEKLAEALEIEAYILFKKNNDDATDLRRVDIYKKKKRDKNSYEGSMSISVGGTKNQ